MPTELFPAPSWLVDSARRFMAAGGEPVRPRVASTVVLLRPADRRVGAGFEVYALRRASTMAFAAGMFAFPGGVVDPRDHTVAPGWAGPAPEWWAARLNLAEPVARAVVCAAVREVFEESGVLLAGPDAGTVVGDVSGAEWEAARVALIERTVGFAELLSSRGLVLRGDLLVPWARWITPRFESRRYDTHFFLARLPTAQRTRDVGGEASQVRWATAGELAAEENPMLPPTRVTLRQLAVYADIDGVLDAASGRDLTPIMPTIDICHPAGPSLVVTVSSPDDPDDPKAF